MELSYCLSSYLSSFGLTLVHLFPGGTGEVIVVARDMDGSEVRSSMAVSDNVYVDDDASFSDAIVREYIRTEADSPACNGREIIELF